MFMKKEYIKLALSFQVSQDASDKAIFISKKFGSKYKSKFILDGKNFYPHITIYPADYPAKNLQYILDGIENVSTRFKPVKMIFSKIEYHGGYIMVYFEQTPEIQELHKRIVETLDGFRDNYINDKYSDLEYLDVKGFNNLEKENIKKYGYPYVMDCYYHPHLSLIKLEDVEDVKTIIDSIDWDIESFDINKLVLHKIAENGAAVEIIKKFNLDKHGPIKF